MNKVWFHSLTSGNVFHVIVTWLMAGNNDWVPSESELSDQSSSLWTLVERRTSIRGGGEGGGADCLTTPGEGTCWRGRGLMNTGEWLSYGSGPAGKIRGLVLILNETLLLFIEEWHVHLHIFTQVFISQHNILFSGVSDSWWLSLGVIHHAPVFSNIGPTSAPGSRSLTRPRRRDPEFF